MPLTASASVAVVIVAAGMVFTSHAAFSLDNPDKPIRIITAEAGGGVDFGARLVGLGLSAKVGKPVIIENRGGGSSFVGEIVAKANPDGYTLLVTANTLWISPFLQNTAYDPVKDFAPVTTMTKSPMLIVVHPSLPARTVRELIALAKIKSGELNYASGPTGAPTHLAPELFKAMAGVNIVRIPYKGSAPALNDVIAGRVEMMIAISASVAQHIKAAKLTALAVTTLEPSPLFPDLPTASASGLPGYESVSVNALFAPARTPGLIIKRLNQEAVRVLNEPDVKTKFLYSGVETVGNSPEQLAATMKSEMVRLGKVIKDAGIRAE